MDGKATKKNGGRKLTRFRTPFGNPLAKPAMERKAIAESPVLLKLTSQALKELQARLIKCSPWLADLEKP